jgi:SAM-dependent methyltransferase
MSDGLLHVPPEFCRNAGTAEDLRNEERSINTAVALIDHLCADLGIDSLAGLDVLDFGCGVRFAQAVVNHRLDINRYVGVDVYREMIEYLDANVADPRLEFAHLDAHNALYNPTGRPFDEAAAGLPIVGQFDVICMFSVVTHLAPHDYVSVLRLLRRFVRPTGRLFYTLFLDEKTEGGHGLIDKFSRALRNATDPEVKQEISRRVHAPDQQAPPGFRDLDPKRPLLYALYTREHALALIEGTGWAVERVLPPGLHLQHHIVCTPVSPSGQTS